MKHVKIVKIVLGCLGFAGAAVAPSAHAQLLTPVWRTEGRLAVGASLPQGGRLGEQGVRIDGRGLDMAGGANAGLTAVGSYGLWMVDSPLGFRLDAQYTRLGLSGDRRVELGGDVPVIADGNASILDATANVVLAMPGANRVRPYLIGGAGVYQLSSDVGYRDMAGRALVNSAPSESETKFGLNGGAGLDVAIGSLRTFVEARAHRVFTRGERANFVPITVGLRF